MSGSSPSQPEVGTYDATVYQIQDTDAVQGAVPGGSQGIVNQPLLNLANRTGWLKAQITTLLNFMNSVINNPPVVTNLSGEATVSYQRFADGTVEFCYNNFSVTPAGGIGQFSLYFPFTLANGVLGASFVPTDIGGTQSNFESGLTLTLISANATGITILMTGPAATSNESVAISGIVKGW